MNYKYIYGPVPSRRLRFSLGIDIIPFKHCSFDCIYCQLGRTTNLLVTRQIYTPTNDILKEIEDVLAKPGTIDYITFSGSGEPTLHSELGVLIQAVREMTSIPVAVLTNSSLIDRADVQKDLQHASVIVPTLCTTMDRTFTTIHRAASGITIATIIDGLTTFRSTYHGAIWLEVMLIKGVNDTDKEIHALKRTIDLIHPDKVHLNTVVRPPSEPWASPVPEETLERARTIIGNNAEIIAEMTEIGDQQAHRNIDNRILGVIERRPLTIEDISVITGLNNIELTKHMTRLLKQGTVDLHRQGNKTFYGIPAKEES